MLVFFRINLTKVFIFSPMKTKYIVLPSLFGLAFLYSTYSFANHNNLPSKHLDKNISSNWESVNEVISNYFIDDSTKHLISGQYVAHKFYSFLYSEKHEQPFWVNYVLTKDMLLNPITKRKDDFRPDPQVTTGSAELVDYVGSGYDRGHLCPAKDMESSVVGMSESFFMSNMSPQHPSLNRGRWKQLEGQVRKWSLEYDSLIVYCGGVLDSISDYIGPNKVAVPEYYYKVVYSVKENKGIAFIMPNKKCELDLTEYAVTIDSVEAITHIDFFEDYPAELQEYFESKYDVRHWFE